MARDPNEWKLRRGLRPPIHEEGGESDAAYLEKILQGVRLNQQNVAALSKVLRQQQAEREAPEMTREEMDAKLATTEARVDKTLAEIRAEFASDRAEMAAFRAQVKEDLAHLPSKGFLTGTAIAIVGVVLTAMAIGVSMMGNGIMLATVPGQDAQRAVQLSEQNQQEINTISTDLREVLQELRELRAAPPATPPAAPE
jgi:hypothetical protein